MTVSNTHLLGDLSNIKNSPLKYQRISDIQDVIEDKYSHANGGETNSETETVEETKSVETNQEKVSADDQAKDVAAKEHAKNEPVRILGVKLGYVILGAAIIGGGIYAYYRYTKN